MDKNEIKNISENYFEYLKKESTFKHLVDDSVEFYSPVVDFFGESISINISKKEDEYFITDFGETLWNLEQHGMYLLDDKKAKKYEIFMSLLNYDGVILNNGKLEKRSSQKNLSQNIHDFIQLISNISELNILKRENIKSFFRDEVINYFIKNRKELYKTVLPDVRIEGKSKITHRFDLAFANEVTDYVKVFRTVNTSNLKNTMFDWEDVAEYRDKLYKTDSRLNLIVDDQKQIPADVSKIIEEYNVRIIDFNNKDQLIDSFSFK
ncbi:DUF1828 domain-containing protein [Macrococcus sp. FSL R5-0951]